MPIRLAVFRIILPKVPISNDLIPEDSKEEIIIQEEENCLSEVSKGIYDIPTQVESTYDLSKADIDGEEKYDDPTKVKYDDQSQVITNEEDVPNPLNSNEDIYAVPSPMITKGNIYNDQNLIITEEGINDEEDIYDVPGLVIIDDDVYAIPNKEINEDDIYDIPAQSVSVKTGIPQEENIYDVPEPVKDDVEKQGANILTSAKEHEGIFEEEDIYDDPTDYLKDAKTHSDPAKKLAVTTRVAR